MSIDNIINGLTYLDPSQLADTLITILNYLITFFAKFWSLLSIKIIDYNFTVLGETFNIEISLFYLITIGGFVLLIFLKLFALIPIVPD